MTKNLTLQLQNTLFMLLKDASVCVSNVILNMTEGKIVSENRGVFKNFER